MSKRREIVDDKNDTVSNKRPKANRKEPEVLIDLTNSQPKEEDKQLNETTPSERQTFFLSQFYNSKDAENNTPKRNFPGPAGAMRQLCIPELKGVKLGKLTRAFDWEHKSRAKKNYQPIKQMKDLDNSLPESNCTWVEMKNYFKLSSSDENDLLNKINIKIVEGKMRKWTTRHSRISIPFLAAIITDDGGLGATSNLTGQKRCISLLLEDFSGSISALVDDCALFHLSHLLQKGASLILAKPEVHKLYGKLNLSLTRDTVVCIAVNNHGGSIKLWKDIPMGFGSRQLENNVIIFEQMNLDKKIIYEEISAFKKIIFPRSPSSLPKTNTSRSSNGNNSEIAVGSGKENPDQQKFEQTGLTGMNATAFDDNNESDDFDISLVEIAEKIEKNYQTMKKHSVTSVGTPPHQEKKEIQSCSGLGQNRDDCNLNDSLLEFVQECAKEMKANKEVNQMKSKAKLTSNYLSLTPKQSAEEKKINSPGTSACLWGESENFCEDDEDDLTLVEALEQIENQSAINLNTEESNNNKKMVVGEFDDESDDELDSLMMSALDEIGF